MVKVFLSHSVSPKEVGILYAIATEAVRQGLQVYIPDRNWSPAQGVPEPIKANILEAQIVLAIATARANNADAVNAELLAVPRTMPVLLVVDEGVKTTGIFPVVVIDRANPSLTIAEVSRRLSAVPQDEDSNRLVTWLAVGALLFLLLWGNNK